VFAALKDDAREIVQAAAVALPEIKDARAIEPLIEALKHDSSTVRRNAAQALGQFRDRRAIQPLRTLLEKEDEYHLTTYAAKQALATIEGNMDPLDTLTFTWLAYGLERGEELWAIFGPLR
jgi:HEAT repeat protein